MAKNKLYWEKEKKRGEKEGKKREKEKEEKKEKKRRKRERKKERGKKGGGSNQKSKRKNKNTREYLLILCTLSPLTSPGTCPSSWSSGGGACCADFQVLALGGAAVPLPGAGLSGGCLPREAAGGTAPVAGQLWKPGFSPRRNSGALRLQGLEAPGRGR